MVSVVREWWFQRAGKGLRLVYYLLSLFFFFIIILLTFILFRNGSKFLAVECVNKRTIKGKFALFFFYFLPSGNIINIPFSCFLATWTNGQAERLRSWTNKGMFVSFSFSFVFAYLRNVINVPFSLFRNRTNGWSRTTGI